MCHQFTGPIVLQSPGNGSQSRPAHSLDSRLERRPLDRRDPVARFGARESYKLIRSWGYVVLGIAPV